jgi:dihydroxy-acid dehydratase
VRDGDLITIDADAGLLTLDVDDRELARRLASFEPPASPYTSGVLARYRLLVGSASEGAVLLDNLPAPSLAEAAT